MSEVSNIATNVPSAAELQNGEIAITYGKGNEGLWLKNSNNEVVKIGTILEAITGQSEVNGMTQKAITDALAELLQFITEVQDMIPELMPITGLSEDAGMTQKAITEALYALQINIENIINELLETLLLQSTGSSTTNGMSQKAITDALNSLKDKITSIETAIGDINSIIAGLNLNYTFTCNCCGDGEGGDPSGPGTGGGDSCTCTQSGNDVELSTSYQTVMTVNGVSGRVKLPASNPWGSSGGGDSVSATSITLATSATTYIDVNGTTSTLKLPDDPPTSWVGKVSTEGDTELIYIGSSTNVNLNDHAKVKSPTTGVEYYFAIENTGTTNITITYPSYNGTNNTYTLASKKFYEVSLLRMPAAGRTAGNPVWLARTALTDPQ